MGVTSDEDATDGDSEAPVGQHPWSYAGRRTGLDGVPRRRLDIGELALEVPDHDVRRQAARQELDTLLQTQQKVAHLRQQAEQRRRATEQAVEVHELRATRAPVECQESAQSATSLQESQQRVAFLRQQVAFLRQQVALHEVAQRRAATA